jgi:ABC-type xylose transport system permease subunit
MTGPKPPLPPLPLIQIAMHAGMLVFLGIVWFVHSQPGFTPTPLPAIVQYMAPVICILALSAIMLVRGLRANITDPQRFASMSIIGWSFGEVAALLGIVYYWFTNDYTWAITGILVQVFGSFMLPARPADR